MSFVIAPEQPDDQVAIVKLVKRAFGSKQTDRAVHRLRQGREPIDDLCFTAKAHGKLVGSLRFWKVALPDGATVPLLGPLAVEPKLRGAGIGRALVGHGLAALRLAGNKAVLIVGDPGYYAPFKFSVTVVESLDLAGAVAPLALMGREYEEGALSHQQGAIRPVEISKVA